MNIDCQALLEGLSDAVLWLNSDGYVQYANPSAFGLLQTSPEALLQSSLSRLYAVDGDPIKLDYELQLARKEGQLVTEGWRYRADGGRFWGETTLTYLAHGVGGQGSFTCVLRDVSERMTREMELREREERFRLMVEGVREYAIFMLDAGGHILTWNEGAQRTKGYRAGEIIGKHFSTFYTAEDLESKKPERELKIAVATGKYEEEGWRVKKNGSVFWANVVITSLFNARNQLIGFSKVTRDLTQRRQEEEALRQNEERYRLLVAQVTDYGIFMMDEKGRIVSWNEGAKRMNGYEANEIIGKYFSIFYPEEDIINGKPARELETARRTGKYEEEGWRLRKDGSRFWANVVITATHNAQGVLIGYSKVTRDLTERKRSEQALRDSYERYRQLAERLRDTNARLSFANEELEQFTSIVSHDLQEPIRTIKSFLQLIEMKLPQGEETLHGYIRKSIAASNRMRELIQNLLHYTQLSRGDLMEDQVPVTDIFQRALQNLRSSIEASDAEITIETDVEAVQGDPIQLVQLVQNLLSNALKFTNDEQPRINVRCFRETDGTVKFAIADNGIGIEQSDMPKVFEIFRRLHTKKEYPGTGIGLAICKKIVDRHRGRIWPESEPGKGTTFFFTIHEEGSDAQTA